jgi:hypothetical protein
MQQTVVQSPLVWQQVPVVMMPAGSVQKMAPLQKQPS